MEGYNGGSGRQQTAKAKGKMGTKTKGVWMLICVGGRGGGKKCGRIRESRGKRRPPFIRRAQNLIRNRRGASPEVGDKE